MLDVHDMLDDGVSYEDIWKALDACETALKGKTDRGSLDIMLLVRDALDDIESMEAMGAFDNE